MDAAEVLNWMSAWHNPVTSVGMACFGIPAQTEVKIIARLELKAKMGKRYERKRA